MFSSEQETREWDQHASQNDSGDSFSSETIILHDTKQETQDIFLSAWMQLNEMRKSGLACDGELLTEDGIVFPIHRIVMIACSPYFKTAFTTHLVGMSGDPGVERRSIVVPCISSEMLKMVIDYAYSLHTPVNGANIHKILKVADQFCIGGMIQDCSSFMQRRLSPSNCIMIWQYAMRYCCQNLIKVSFRYILKRFQKITLKNNGLLKLSPECLSEILENDELEVLDEYQIWKCINNWVAYEPGSRLDCFPELLHSIRFGLLSENVFQNISAHPCVKNNARCDEIMKKAMKAIDCRHLRNTAKLSSFGKMTSHRLPSTFILAIGGWHRRAPIDLFEVYDKNMNHWTLISANDPNGPRAYHQIQLVMDTIYILGGTNGHESLRSCHAFNLITRTWREIASMNFKRCYLCSVFLHDHIYVMGGFDGNFRMSSVEKYDFLSNQWSYVSPMIRCRSDASACVLSEKILVCGGFNGENYLNTVEIYDPNFNQWSFVAPMSSKRSGLSCIAYSTSACIVIGGFSGLIRLTTVERYDAIADRWTNEPNMKYPRSNFSVVIMNDSIYACGGYDGVSTINSVERFDLRTHFWNSVGRLNIQRSALACCVVEDLENAQDFFLQDRTISYSKWKKRNTTDRRNYRGQPRSYPITKKH